MNKCWCLWCILSWMAFVTFLCLCVIWATWEKSAFFFPPPFSSILRMRAFFSLLMFASVWLKAFNFFSKPAFEALLFLRSIRRLTLLTPSFAIMLFFFPLGPKCIPALKANEFVEASVSEANTKNNVLCPKKLVFFF